MSAKYDVRLRRQREHGEDVHAVLGVEREDANGRVEAADREKASALPAGGHSAEVEARHLVACVEREVCFSVYRACRRKQECMPR